MTKMKWTALSISLAAVIGIVTAFIVVRENDMRRAAVSLDLLAFDGMEFVRCSDYQLIDDLEPSGVICKSTNGDWRIFSVKNYERSYEYVYARLTFDGYFYERLK